MIVYHGSQFIVKNPDLKLSRKELDFGVGFYVTKEYEQAEKWSKRLKNKAIISHYVNIYDLDDIVFTKYKILEFNEYSKDWLEFVTKCRLDEDDSDYDIVIGGIANDKVFDTIELYFNRLITADEAIGKLKYEKLNSQICIRKQEIIDKNIKFIEAKS